MASKNVRPTPPPSGPALARPALGALLLGLTAGVACGDDGTGNDTANDSQPPMPESEGPMPNPTTDAGSTTAVPPMIPPTSTTDDGADSGSSSTGDLPPMPPPTTGEATDGTTGGSTGELPPMPPPMPPPDGGGAPHDDQEL